MLFLLCASAGDAIPARGSTAVLSTASGTLTHGNVDQLFADQGRHDDIHDRVLGTTTRLLVVKLWHSLLVVRLCSVPAARKSAHCPSQSAVLS